MEMEDRKAHPKGEPTVQCQGCALLAGRDSPSEEKSGTSEKERFEVRPPAPSCLDRQNSVINTNHPRAKAELEFVQGLANAEYLHCGH